VRGTDQGFRIVVVPRAEPEGAGAAPAEKKSASSAKSAESPPKADDRSADRAFDAVYITTAATGEKIPHPLSRKSSPITVAGKTVAVPEGMVYVPAGEFTMGEDNNPPKSPAHTVNVQAFFMAKYEVTNAEYLEFVKATWHTMPEHWLKNGGKIPPGRENHPVVFVSWEDAKAYCDWCGKRLPTEAEWEKAASWDSIKKRKNGYPWGSKPDSDPNRPLSNWAARLGCKSTLTEDWEAWWTGFKKTPEYTRLAELGGGTTPVGTFKAGVSVNGCYDMGGNVSEWVQDWFDKYPGAKELPAEWEADCGRKKRVYRDGTWYSPAGSAACVIRGRAGVSYVTYTLGFRCAADCPWKLETQSRDRKGRSSEVVCRSSEVAK
jgi:formylglycine-generating enzyme required for sulfatase activity